MEIILCLGGDHISLKPETEFEKEFINKYYQKDIVVARKSGGELHFKFSTSSMVWDQEKE